MPGIPKGRKLIFVGFQDGRGGFKVFDPETRSYHSTGNCYFYENFMGRIDALRHHDQRRALLKKGLEQPVVMDDFADSNSQAVRNLFLDPDASSSADPSRASIPVPSQGLLSAQSGGVPLVVRRDAKVVISEPRRSALELSTDDARPGASTGPISSGAVAAERVKQLAQRDVMLRPLRLLAIGKEQLYTPEDRAFLQFVASANIPLTYQSPCPKALGS